MQNVSCPSCGAPLAFKSHAAVMAVCEFCRATVIKDAESVRDIGKMSAVLEDYSPIQIGTSGVAGTRQFSVIGRIQLRYAQGFWNEWFLLYDDGATGWLGDSSGLYVITTERALAADTPSFPDIEVGKLYTIEGERFTASEKREAQCIGGQGELPFKVGEGWRVRVADMRAGGRFVTLDYSEGERPVLYDGVSVKLEQLKCQLLRDDEQIKASAGRYRGKLDSLDCPSCGSAIRYLPGVTGALVCPACAARLDAASSQVQVLQAGEKVERARLSLPLGASANILGSSRTVIGAIRRRDGEGESWTEYLLYSARAGFMWLIESDDGWYRSTVLDTWPSWTWTGADNARLEGVPYTRLYDYPATVTFAAGAFNWRVAVGDQVRVYEFEAGPNTIAAELTAEEMTWSRSIPVAHDQIRTWFGTAAPRLAESRAAIKPERNALPVKFMWWIIGLNFIPLMANFFTTAIIIVIALVALFFPPAVFGNDK